MSTSQINSDAAYDGFGDTDTVVAKSLPKILIVAPSIRTMGGQAVNAKQLLRDFKRVGIQADFQPINPEPPGVLAYAENIKYVRTAIVSFFYVLSLLWRVPRYDVVHIFSASYFSFIIAQTPAILISRMYGKKIVLNYRSGECDDHLQKWKRIVYPILRRIDQIVVPSGFLVEVFAKHGFDAVAISNVVDEAEFPYVNRPVIRPKILVPRMLDSMYNVECSIRAFEIVKRQVPKAEITLLGDGPQEAYLKKLVADLNLSNATFAGRVSREQIGQVYKEHDIFLNTSSIDNMPTSILEAFAVGLPVVTTNAGGIPFIVDDRETGHMVPVNDHEAIARRLLEVIHDEQSTKAMVQRAREKSENYRWPAVEGKWRALYDTLLDTKSNSAAKC